MKIRIKYESERNGRVETSEVVTNASSEAVAKAEFERKCKGKFSRVTGTQVVK